MKNFIEWTLNRLAENSTWRGAFLVLTAAGVTIRPELADKIIALGLAAVGLINIIRKAPDAPDRPNTSPAP